MHLSPVGGAAHGCLIFGKFVNAAGAQHIYSTRASSTVPGLTGYMNASEVIRFDQRGDTANVGAAPAQTANLGVNTFLAWSTPANGGTVRTWNGTTTKVSTSRSFNACISAPSQDLIFGAQSDLSGELENLTEVYAIVFYEGYLDDAQVSSIVAAMETRHGIDYTV
jgi:hypothetical protein